MNNVIKEAANRISVLKNVQNNISAISMHDLPGTLRVSHDHGKVRYYLQPSQSNGNDIYLGKNKLPQIIALAQDGYNKKALKLAESEIDYLERFIRKYPQKDIESLYEMMNIDRKKLITPIILPDDEYIADWLSQEYVRKPFSDYDTSQYYTDSGIRVRSKSEILIANALEKNHIPFFVEKPLFLRGLGTIYPDFTILNVSKRIVFIWEHHGLLDDRDYRENNFLVKNSAYISNGFFPGKNLIQTFESLKNPIGVPVINSIINEYLI